MQTVMNIHIFKICSWWMRASAPYSMIDISIIFDNAINFAWE